jgi:hypothetical protein
VKRTAAFAALGLAVMACAAVSSGASKPASPPLAAASPRYSGLWRLDTTKTEMGKRLPRSREDRMSEQGAWLSVSSLTVRASGDTMRLDYRYRMDGGEAVNRVLGQDVKTRGWRDGAALRFDSEAQLALFKFTVNERWSLSPDGSKLTQERTSHGPLGDEKQRLVFVRSTR